jgi:conjugal transfer/entry exclusion protein
MKLIAAVNATVLALAALVHTPTNAFVVFDPTNFIQNTVSALKSVQQVSESIQQTRQQIMMANKMRDDVRGLDGSKLLGQADPETARQLKMLNLAQSDMSQLEGQLVNVDRTFKTRMAAADSQGLTMAQYLDKLMAAARAGDATAAKTVQRDMSTLQGVQNQIQQTKVWRSEIGGLNDNLGGSMQLMNTQLNAMVSQNAELLGYMARESAERAASKGDAPLRQRAAVEMAAKERAEEQARRIKREKALSDGVKGGWDDPFAPKK